MSRPGRVVVFQSISLITEEKERPGLVFDIDSFIRRLPHSRLCHVHGDSLYMTHCTRVKGYATFDLLGAIEPAQFLLMKYLPA